MAGYEAVDVRDVGLRSAPDADIFAFAQAKSAALISADRDFMNVRRFPLGSYAGIIVVRISNRYPIHVLNREIMRAIREFDEAEFSGALVTVEIGITRIQRPPAP